MERFFNQHGIPTYRRHGHEAATKGSSKRCKPGWAWGFCRCNTIGLSWKTKRLKVLDVKGFPHHAPWYVVHRKDKRYIDGGQAFKGFFVDRRRKQILGQ